MKKHQKYSDDKVMRRLADELNSIKDIRLLSLVGNLYVEYYINEIITKKLKNPELIIDNINLGTFSGKFTILITLGTFTNKTNLKKSIEIINSIRNHFAHNMIFPDGIPEKVINYVKQLETYFSPDVKYIPSRIPEKMQVALVNTIWNLKKISTI